MKNKDFVIPDEVYNDFVGWCNRTGKHWSDQQIEKFLLGWIKSTKKLYKEYGWSYDKSK